MCSYIYSCFLENVAVEIRNDEFTMLLRVVESIYLKIVFQFLIIVNKSD